MFWAMATLGWPGPEVRLEYHNRPAIEGLGLLWPAPVPKQRRQVVECGRNFDMIGSEVLLVNLKRLPHQGFGLGEPVCVFKKLRQVAEG